MQIETLRRAATAGDGAAAFELAQWHARRREMPDALRWLAHAADAGHAEAANELGMLAAFAPAGGSRDAVAARTRFDAAAVLGHAEASYRLAVLDLGLEEAAPDPILVRLHDAARGGFAPAQRALGMAWFAAGDLDAARACFAVALAAGDALSAFLLARLSADPAQARGLDAFALARGVRRAGAFVDGPAPFASPMVPALPGVPPATALDAVSTPAVARHEAPPIATFDGVFSALDCEYAIVLASPHVQRSMVHDPVTGGPMLHPIRTSSSMAFGVDDEDLWLRVLQRRLARLARQPLRHAEPLAVLRYAPGEEYRPHRDYLRDPAELAPGAPGQRVRTAFAYLTDVAAGGETDFPLLAVRIAPARGRVVLFDNVDAAGRVDPSTLHAGLPVREGRKWLATLWFRERAYRAW
ncbi:2OG-Fe(II) oxygenase [Dokdonella sp. MW10]|uniref:2OG-Fe(II) oxygenase n=1 Tax=Dokdonella sp. MW10 TaxID=2992926 RepID=UPI003F80B871